MQAKEVAVTLGNAFQGKEAVSGTIGQRFPSAAGAYSITQSLPRASPEGSSNLPTQRAASKQVPKATPRSSSQQPAEDLLGEALRQRQGPAGGAPTGGARVSAGDRSQPESDPAAKREPPASDGEDLLKEALAYRRQGVPSNGSPPPGDPRDNSKKSPKPAAVPPKAQAKPEENLLEEALKNRQASPGTSKGSSAAGGREPGASSAPKPPQPAQSSQAEVKGPNDNLLEEAMRLRGQGSSKPSSPAGTATGPAKGAPGRGPVTTFNGNRSDDLIFKARDATPSFVPGQKQLKPQAEGAGSKENVDALGSKWRGASAGNGDKPSAADLPRSDDLIMQANKSLGGRPEGLPTLDTQASSGTSSSSQTNPAAKLKAGFGGSATQGPLKGALRRQQEQSSSTATSQPAEQPSQGDDLLAEAMRLRGSPASSSKPAPAKAPVKETKPPSRVEQPSGEEDLLAESLRLRGTPAPGSKAPAAPTARSATAGATQAKPAQTGGAADDGSDGSDLLAEAMKLRNASPSSSSQTNPAAKLKAGIGGSATQGPLKGALRRQQEQTAAASGGQSDSEPAEASEGKEEGDLLAEAMRLRGASPDTKPRAAPKPARTQGASSTKGSDSAEGGDLLGEALRLRGERSAPAAASQPSSALKASEGGDLLEEALRMRQEGRGFQAGAKVCSAGLSMSGRDLLPRCNAWGTGRSCSHALIFKDICVSFGWILY